MKIARLYRLALLVCSGGEQASPDYDTQSAAAVQVRPSIVKPYSTVHMLFVMHTYVILDTTRVCRT